MAHVIFSLQYMGCKIRPSEGTAPVVAALLMVVFSTGPAVAQQTGSVRGIVYDKDFEAPLPGAHITLLELDQQAESTDEGNYLLSDVPPGTYTLVFSKQGFTRNVKSDVLVSPGRMTEVDAWLSGDFTDMQEFVVQDFVLGGSTEIGLLNLRMEMPEMMDSVSSELISQAGAGDAAAALKLVSGATVQDGKYAVVRGLPDRYVNSQMNKVRLPTADADKRAVQLDQFPSALIESIQVSKTFTPDQQGDASGGAVNVVLKSLPDEQVFNVSVGTGYDSDTTGNKRFLTYSGGGVNMLGMDDGTRELPFGVEDAETDTEDAITVNDPAPTQQQRIDYQRRERQADAFSPVMGVHDGDAPLPSYSLSLTAGDRWDVGEWQLGALGSLYYKRDNEHRGNVIEDKLFGNIADGAFEPASGSERDDYELFDVTESTQSLQWGGLFSVGAKRENHEFNLTYMRTQNARDSAVLKIDTRAVDENVDDGSATHYYRNEMLHYVERSTSTLQLRGKHSLPQPPLSKLPLFSFSAPQLDWTIAASSASMNEPDFRTTLSSWTPETSRWVYVPIVNATGTAGLRTWKDITETSEQAQMNLKLPFTQWSDTEGYLKGGLFDDRSERTYEQDSFSYKYGPGALNSPGTQKIAPFDKFSYSSLFADQYTGYEGDLDGGVGSFFAPALHNEMPWQIVRYRNDADYDGEQRLQAWYWMGDLPLTSRIKLVGGVRTEKTTLNTSFRAADGKILDLYQWTGDPATGTGILDSSRLDSEHWHEADASIDRTDTLPSLNLELTPREDIKLRLAYSETVARPTFKEIAPVLQLNYVESEMFIGNNNLNLSEVENYDIRVEYLPSPDTFLSASYFRKDIVDPIEYATVNVIQTQAIQPFNFPDGQLSGFEFEARQKLGKWRSELEGLQVRFNATIINSSVSVPERLPETPQRLAGKIIPSSNSQKTFADTRDMRGAPAYLLNANLTYDLEPADLRLTLFYTHKGDTLVTGEGESDGKYVPNTYETEYGTLNVGVVKHLSEKWKLSFRIKNLLDPEIETVYRSDHISGDATKTSYRKGRSFSLSLSGKF